MGGHVELARHVGVLHEAVVQPRPRQFAVTHRRVRVESAGVLSPGLRLELVQVRACREAGEAAETGPGGLLIEMDPSGIRRGGDILDNDNTMIT